MEKHFVAELSALLPVTGEVARHLGLLTPQQITDICWVQAFESALIKQGLSLDSLTEEEKRYLAYPRKEGLQTVAHQRGMDLKAIEAEAATYSPTSFPPKGVSRFMDVAERMTILPKAKSNPVLAAQAGGRMAYLLHQVKEGTAPLQLHDKPFSLADALNPDKHRMIDDSKAKGEPEYLTAAQATQHLAEIFTTGLAEKASPELAKDADVLRALTAFQIYASQTLKRAGSELGGTEGKTIADSRETLHGINRVGIFSEWANTSALVKDMDRGFRRLGLPAEALDTVKTRLEQARGMKHVGIAIHPFTRHQEKLDSGWVDRISAQKNTTQTRSP